MKFRLASLLALATLPVYAQPAPEASPPTEPTSGEASPAPGPAPDTPSHTSSSSAAVASADGASAPASSPGESQPAAFVAAPAALGQGPVERPAASITETGDAKPKPLDLSAGGYLQADTRSFATDTGSHDQTLRRLRFKADAKAFKYFRASTLIETASSRLQVLNAWLELAPRPEIAIRVGKDKAQFGIERLQSATAMTFIERGYPTQLAPNRDIGVAVRGDIAGGILHYSAAVVNGVANNAVLESETDDELEYNLHVLVSPLKKAVPSIDFAIGGAATFGRTHGTLASTGLSSIKSAGQVTIVRFVGGGATDTMDTTAVADGFRKRFTGHAYYYGGPIGALAEYVADTEPVALAGTHTPITNHAWQIATSFALTPGDRPSYKGLSPKKPFDLEERTWGALEIAARYSELRIDEAAFEAGILKDTASVSRARAGTLGVNWYFNKHFKLQLNYEATKFKGGAENGDRPSEHLIATRFQAAI